MSKIKPYIPKKLAIDSKSTYSTFMKHKPKILSHFIFNNSASSSSGRHKHPQKLLRVNKQLKHVRHLDLGRFYLQRVFSNLPYMMSSAKRMSRVHFLSTINSQNIKAPSLKIFKMWPKYIYRLKALIDSADRNQLWLVLNESSFRHIIKESPKSVLFRYQNRHLESLQINFHPNISVINHLQFDQYPREIKKLSLFGGVFADPVPLTTSFAHFKSLQVLELNFNKESSAKFLNSLVRLLPEIPNLESLSLFSPLEAFSGLEESFKSMKSLAMLKNFKIHACNLGFSHSKALLKVLMEFSSLKSLYLKVRIENAKEVNLILKLLGRLKELEALKLHIYHKNILEPSAVEKIFAKVDHLQYLKRLSLTVNISKKASTFTRKYNGKIETIHLPLSKLFTKQIPLESFQVESNNVNISNETFLSLLKALQKQSSHLKKVKLAIGEVFLDQKEFTIFSKFLQSIHKEIRVLKLSMLGVYNKSHFMEIAETVETMKYLRNFGLGKFYVPVTKSAFWKGIIKILCKHGLVKFSCSATRDFKKKALSYSRTESGINWLKLKKENPALEKIPRVFSSISKNGVDPL